MRATLALLLSLCLVLVDLSLGNDNVNTDARVIPKARDADSGKKCERMFPKLADITCVYRCRGLGMGFEKEDDGTPCTGVFGFFPYQGKCKNGWCVPGSSRISVRSVEPSEESPEPTEESPEPAEESPEPAEESPEPAEESPEPAEESPEPAEETPERVTYWTVD